LATRGDPVVGLDAFAGENGIMGETLDAIIARFLETIFF